MIAWDGHTLASDRQISWGDTVYSATKIFKFGDLLIGCAGDQDYSVQITNWVINGRINADFPISQQDEKHSVDCIVIEKESGAVYRYGKTPHPIYFEDKFIAIGNGMDFALAAMHCGKNSHDAVEIAIMLCNGCGCGVDTLTFDDGYKVTAIQTD